MISTNRCFKRIRKTIENSKLFKVLLKSGSNKIQHTI